MARRSNVNLEALADLRRAQKRLDVAERDRDDEIFRAHLAGNGLRVLAGETGLSHEGVRTIVERRRRWVEAETEILALDIPGMSLSQIAEDEKDRAARRKRLDYLLSVRQADG